MPGLINEELLSAPLPFRFRVEDNLTGIFRISAVGKEIRISDHCDEEFPEDPKRNWTDVNHPDLPPIRKELGTAYRIDEIYTNGYLITTPRGPRKK